MPGGRPALAAAVLKVIARQKATGKPLAIILAGHNGSGKSTMWYKHVVDLIRIPLVNADRMMLSVLPEVDDPKKLPRWASSIRDADTDWMQVAQKGVESFVAHAMGRKVPFAQETVFSYWKENKDGTVSSKIDLLASLQQAGYFVLLFFVGLRDVQLSIGRVSSRKNAGGHDVAVDRLIERFPRTQKAIGRAINVADAAILIDNSRPEELAFTICRVQSGSRCLMTSGIGNSRCLPKFSNGWIKFARSRRRKRNPATSSLESSTPDGSSKAQVTVTD